MKIINFIFIFVLNPDLKLLGNNLYYRVWKMIHIASVRKNTEISFSWEKNLVQKAFSYIFTMVTNLVLK